MDKNIVITGEGIISAIGNDKAAVLQSLLDGRSGIVEMKHLHSSHHELPVGEVQLSNDEMKAMLALPVEEQTSRTSLMGMLAVRQALAEAQLPETAPKNRRVVLISGTTVGGMDITEQYYDSFATSDEHLDCLKKHDCGSSTEEIAAMFGISECTTISTACSSAANALILGANLLKTGQADLVIAGGSEALTRFHLNGFNSLMILDHEPCRPFDAQRAGLNLGEGAAFVVMETEASARERGAEIHAWLTGYGNACDAFHQTASSDNGEGAYRAMTEALEMAQLKPKDIDYVNAHGTGTPNNDLSESAALKRVFAEKMPLISSTKAFTGHTTSASGSIETVICLLAMQHHFVPANLRWEHQIPDGITPTTGVKDVTLKHVVCNAFGFGGNDSSLILSAVPVAGEESAVAISDDDIRVAAKVEITSEEALSEIRNYVKPLEARRMGKIMKSSLLSSLKAMEQAGIEKPDAIITATALGCLENSERLLNQLQEEGEVMLKPTYFMQSTHNTIGSGIAIFTKCHGYNVTYTHGKDSLEWALRDARMLLKSGKAKSVLVGLHDETTPLYRSLMQRIGIDNLLPSHSIAMVLEVKS
ncbi:MAG: beta-ketoacyl-[Prevotella sp.]|nr:beta-ketoacyl-[acyl-carrier-protein] synthase family protein [Prevotella sp.]